MAGTKPNPRQRAAVKRASLSSPRVVYLIAYNLASACAWACVLYLGLSSVLPAMEGAIKAGAKWEGVVKAVERAGATTFSQHGELVQWVQTAAALEVVHAGLGLVRSSLVTTAAQVFSRFVVVWGVGHFFPAAAHTPIYVSMITAWSLAEITRYLHYAAGLASIKVPLLEWIRYSAFYILYPVGAGSEAWLMLRAAPLAGAKYGEAAKMGVYALTAVWPPALFVLMSHMTAQRRKYLGTAKASAVQDKATASSSTPRRSARNTAVAAFVPKVEEPAPKAETTALKAPKAKSTPARSASPRRSARSSLAGSPAPSATGSVASNDTPGRSTRSRSKAPQ